MINNNMNISRKEYLQRLLCPFWLRPETALWYAHEAYWARQYLGYPISQPSMELGGMEGVSTFIMLGGEFGLNFDTYSEVSWDKNSKHWHSLDDDYYDVYDSDKIYDLDIVQQPLFKFDIGLSWKESHIKKASRLNIHQQFIEHDPNTPLKMFEEQQFATIWAPNLYWIDNLFELLSELRRILHHRGRLVTVLPDKLALDYMLYKYIDKTNSTWIRDLDRGRYSNISRQARTLNEWNELFELIGFDVIKQESFLPKIVFQVSDIGLRPMFPVMMHIYEVLRTNRPKDWIDIKKHWIETIFHFLSPMCDVSWMESMQMENVWHIFHLQPKY